MNLTDLQRRLIVIGIAIIFILMGVAQAVFKFDSNHWLIKDLSLILMAGAAMILLGGRKKEEPRTPAEDQVNPELTETAKEEFEPKE